MKKRLIGLGLVLALTVGSMAACGKDNTVTPTQAPAPTQQASNSSSNTTATQAPAPTDAPVVTVTVEDKTVSAAAQTLATQVTNDFGGTMYLLLNQNAYNRMKTGKYSESQNIKATVGDKNAAVTLNMAVLYNKLRMSYTLADDYNAADGITYKKGDMLPTWTAIGKNLNFTINDVTDPSATKVSENYTTFQNTGFTGVDVLCASAAQASEDGQTGNFIQLDQYLDQMPNFKAFLEQNEVVKMVLTAGDGHIYYAPYFDGYNDIEKTFLVRVDWVKKLLDGDLPSNLDSKAYAGSFTYTNYMPDSYTLDVDVVKADGTGVEKLTKNVKKNITDVLAESDKTGAGMVKALRNYIDETYNGYYGSNRSDLFCGQNAAWDADEYVALVRCVVANPQFLAGQDVVYGIFGREATLQRNSDLFTLAANLFGVRGADAEKDWLYFDANGNLQDARQSEKMYYAMEKFAQMYADGLILADFDKEGAGGASGTKVYDTMYKGNLGFGLYDYVQTQTAYNDTVKVEGFDLEPIINPIAYWETSANGGEFMRFSESWRSVKTEGWVITAECAKDANKLANALELFDYMYSTEGNTLMSYGPDAWIEHDASGNIVTIDYQGTQVPKLSAAALNELKTLEGGNYTNYYRQRLGATFPIGYVKQQGMEFQCTSEKGKAGLAKVNKAIELGVLKHVEVNTAGVDPFYWIIPTTFATTSAENTQIKDNCANLANYFSKEKGKYNIFIDAIKYGFEQAISNKAQ